MITCKVETIDRDTADRYLNLDRGNNRPFSPWHLIDLVGRQMRGEWVTNGDTIRFDAGGQLRDGQHRLRMVKQTGKPIEVVVVRDIDPEAFVTMDVGKKRTFGDVLSIEKEDNHAQLAVTTSWVWRYLTRRMLGLLGSYEQMLCVLHDHPQIRDSVLFYKQLDHPLGEPHWSSLTQTAHYLFSRVDAIEANDFIEKYVTGLGLVESTDAIKVIRDQVVKYASDPRKPIGNQVFALLCRAWNYHQVGQPAKKKFKLPVPIKASPRIDGFPKELFLESQLSFEAEEGEEGD